MKRTFVALDCCKMVVASVIKIEHSKWHGKYTIHSTQESHPLTNSSIQCQYFPFNLLINSEFFKSKQFYCEEKKSTNKRIFVTNFSIRSAKIKTQKFQRRLFVVFFPLFLFIFIHLSRLFSNCFQTISLFHFLSILSSFFHTNDLFHQFAQSISVAAQSRLQATTTTIKNNNNNTEYKRNFCGKRKSFLKPVQKFDSSFLKKKKFDNQFALSFNFVNLLKGKYNKFSCNF